MAETKEAPPQEARPASVRCPACGAEGERGQLVCLECGGRLALDYRKPTGWRPAVAVVAIVLAAAAGAFALTLVLVGENAEDELARQGGAAAGGETETGGERDRRGSTAPREDRSRSREGGRERRERRSSPEGAERREGASGGLRRRDGLVVWPRGRSAYTVVLLSAGDRPSAVDFARNARDRGAREVGVLRSNDYPSLGSGFWIVFNGVHRSRAEAERSASRLGGRFPGAFPQLVESRR